MTFPHYFEDRPRKNVVLFCRVRTKSLFQFLIKHFSSFSSLNTWKQLVNLESLLFCSTKFSTYFRKTRCLYVRLYWSDQTSTLEYFFFSIKIVFFLHSLNVVMLLIVIMNMFYVHQMFMRIFYIYERKSRKINFPIHNMVFI